MCPCDGGWLQPAHQPHAATRRRLLDQVTTDLQLVAGMHMHYPGFAHVVKHGDSYLMLPEPWDQAF